MAFQQKGMTREERDAAWTGPGVIPSDPNLSRPNKWNSSSPHDYGKEGDDETPSRYSDYDGERYLDDPQYPLHRYDTHTGTWVKK